MPGIAGHSATDLSQPTQLPAVLDFTKIGENATVSINSEHTDDRRARLLREAAEHTQKLGFQKWGAIVLLVALAFCVGCLVWGNPSDLNTRLLHTVITAIITGTVGFATGKALK